MARLYVIACLALAAAVAPAGDGGKGYDEGELRHVSGPDTLGRGWHPGIVRGEPRVVRMSDCFTHWALRRTRDGTLILPEHASGEKPLYLSYDPTGERAGVFLSEKVTEGSYWTVRGLRSATPYSATIQARNGKAAGRHLGAGAEAEKLRDHKDKPFRARQMVLLESPKDTPHYYVAELSK
jgi:hypothetical protein